MFHPTLRRRQWGHFVLVVLAACAFLTVPSTHAQTHAAPPSAVVPAKPSPGDTLSIGPGLFTFPQIAGMLSTKGQAVTCDVSMKDRAAYVFLQPRTRAQANEILGAGLQVEFVLDDKTKGLTMVRQKAVAAREAQWLKRLARILQNEWQAELQKTTALSQQPFADRERTRDLEREANKLHDVVGEPPFDTPPATEAIARQRAQLQELDTRLEAEYHLPSAQERMLASWAQINPPDFVSLLQGKSADFGAQPLLPQWMENGWAKQALLEKQRLYTGKPVNEIPLGFTAQDYQWLPKYDFSWGPLLTIAFSGHGDLVHQPSDVSEATYKAAVAPLNDKTKVPTDAEKDYANRVHSLEATLGSQIRFGLPNDTLAVPGRIPAPLFVLGQEAVDWWTQEQAATDQCLKMPPLDLPAPVASLMLPNPKATREVVMELHPRAELWQASSGINEAAPTLASWIHPAVGADQWSVREKEKVLLITNRLAFMERPQTVPLGEWVDFSDELRLWHEKNDAIFEARYGKSGTSNHRFIDGFYPYEPLARYAHEVTTRRDGRTWRALGTTNYSYDYHGVNLRALDATVPAVFLWGKLPEKERAQLLSRLETPTPDSYGRFSKARLPMSRFSDATLITLAQLLHERGWQDADPRDPTLIAYLRSCIFYIVLHIDPRMTLPGYEARIVFSDPLISPDLQTGASFWVAAPRPTKTRPPTPQTP